MEEWRTIDGFPGYEVSSNGRVRSWRPRNHHPSPTIPVILKPNPGRYGYRMVVLSTAPIGNGVQVTKKIHRLVAEAFFGPCPQGYEAAHLDGDKTNNAASNVRWSTHVDNEADKLRHGTLYCGEQHHLCKLSKEDVRVIRETKGPRGIGLILADRYGVNPTTISQIRLGKIWKHI